MDVSNLGQLGGGLGGLDFDDVAPGEEKKKKSKKKDDIESSVKGDLIHIRVQQRNGRKCITTVQGLHQDLDLKKILKALKKQECCNGTVVEDEEMGAVLQLQGDQRDSVAKVLTEMGAPQRQRI
jgi:translation initiation factor 1